MKPSARAFFVWVALPLLAILAGSIWFNFDYFRFACERQTDYVLLSLNVENALHGEAFTGAYSRLGFRHPGPILFYVYAAGEYVFQGMDRAIGRHALSQLVVSAGFLLVTLYAIFRTVRPRWMAFVFGAVFVMVARGHAGSSLATLSDIWNPYPAIASMFCLVVTSALVSRGDLRWMFPWSLAAIVSVHTHLGAMPVAVGISGVALALGSWERWRAKRHYYRMRWSAVEVSSVALGVTALCLSSLPIVMEALQSERGGNLGAIIAFSSKAQVSQSLGTVMPALFAQYRKVVPISVPPWVGAGLLLFACGTLGFVRGREPLVRMVVLGLAGTAFAVLSLLRTQGELFPYLFMYHFSVAAVVVAGTIALVAKGSKVLRRSWHTTRRAFGGACAVWLTVSVWTLATPLRATTSCGALGEARSFLAALSPRRNTLYRITVRDPELRDSLARFALVLRRHHVRFCFEGPWTFMVDSSLGCSFPAFQEIASGPVTEVLLADLENGPLPAWGGQAKVRSVGIAWRKRGDL